MTPGRLLLWVGALAIAFTVVLIIAITLLWFGHLLTPRWNTMGQFGIGFTAFLCTALMCAYVTYSFVRVFRKKEETLKMFLSQSPFKTDDTSCGKGVETGLNNDVIHSLAVMDDAARNSSSRYIRDPSSSGDHVLIVRDNKVPDDKVAAPKDKDRMGQTSEC